MRACKRGDRSETDGSLRGWYERTESTEILLGEGKCDGEGRGSNYLVIILVVILVVISVIILVK